MNNLLTVRNAVLDDIDRIYDLLDEYAKQNIVLPRSKEDIALFISNFTVAEFEDNVCGCVAVRDFGNNLFEIRSLVVSPELQNKGIGKAMINSVIETLKVKYDNWRLFALTLSPDFFAAIGFKKVEKDLFPEKIWSDCSKCSKRCCCDEIAYLLDSDYCG